MTTPAVPAITIELYRPASSSGVEGRALDTPPGSASSTGLSVEERLQNALLADQQARLTEYVGWELDEEMEEEDEGSDAEDPDWHAIQREQTRLMNTRSSRDQETVPVPVGMDPVLKALEAESRLNVEVCCLGMFFCFVSVVFGLIPGALKILKTDRKLDLTLLV